MEMPIEFVSGQYVTVSKIRFLYFCEGFLTNSVNIILKKVRVNCLA
jgi:hypothetical protein